MWGVSSVWRQRVMLSMIDPSGTAGDYGVTIPPELDEFWSAIDSSAAELRITNAAGAVLSYMVPDDGAGGAFDKANRLGRLRIKYTPPAAGVSACWLYYNPSSTQGSAASAPGVSITRTGYIELARPSGRNVIGHRSPLAGNQSPPQRRTLTDDERMEIWLYLGGHIEPSFTPVNGGNLALSLYYVTHPIYDTACASVSLMVDDDSTRLVEIPHGKLAGTWVRYVVRAGTPGNWYTSSLVSRIVGSSLSPIRSTVDTRVGIYCSQARRT